jgi:hypothetical protein
MMLGKYNETMEEIKNKFNKIINNNSNDG